MKVLWLGGIVLPLIAEKEKIRIEFKNGWLIKLSESLKKDNQIDLVYVFDSKYYITGETDYYKYYGIERRTPSTVRLGNEYIESAKNILKTENPEIIHIWGTERPHTLAMIEAANQLGISDRVVVSVQGLVSKCYYHYCAYIPYKVAKGHTLRDFFQGNVLKKQENFKVRGEYEIEALQSVNNVIGRTDWDRACIWDINPKANYHYNNETLRDEFYTGQWNISNCIPHSIFISQSDYPLKGLHLVLEAMPKIIDQFPDTHLYIAGKNHLSQPKWKRTRYEEYLFTLIKRYQLEKHISFTGNLSAKEMKERLLNSNVFVCASSIENSPNSLGEAMLLGLPCVATNVGGIPSLLVHGKEGFLYPADETYMLSYYICKLFYSADLSKFMGDNARKRALITHNPQKNQNDLLAIYKMIKGNS